MQDWTIVEPNEEPDSDPDVIYCAVCMGLDQWMKYGISGSGWAGVRTPDARMDGLFFSDAYRAPFIDYLRLCFRWAGLPGLRSAEVERDLRYLTADLPPL